MPQTYGWTDDVSFDFSNSSLCSNSNRGIISPHAKTYFFPKLGLAAALQFHALVSV
jgi:hypothetical protein